MTGEVNIILYSVIIREQFQNNLGLVNQFLLFYANHFKL